MPNIKICSVAGIIGAGANCAYTLDSRTEEMNLDQLIDFLEPNEETEKAGAMIMSAKAFQKIKTEFEKACRRLGGRCKKDMKKMNIYLKQLSK